MNHQEIQTMEKTPDLTPVNAQTSDETTTEGQPE